MTLPNPMLAEAGLSYVITQAPIEGKVILGCLLLFSVFAWSVLISKFVQMRRAKLLNDYFDTEFRKESKVLAIFDRRVMAEGCPLFGVYHDGAQALDSRLKKGAESRSDALSLKSMEHVKRSVESAVAREALRLESGLIMLAIAVSGAPFLGLLGTVWGVMITFADVGDKGTADLATMAPGVAAALVTTVAGLLVALPSMFGYNWLVHNLRVETVNLDNFSQELVSRMEMEYLKDE